MSNEHDDKENMHVRVTRKLRKKTEIMTIIIIKISYYKLNNKTVDKPSMRKNEKKKKGKEEHFLLSTVRFGVFLPSSSQPGALHTSFSHCPFWRFFISSL